MEAATPPSGEPADEQPPTTTTGRLRAVAGAPARHVLDAYSGEHGVYGIVLVTALIAVGWEDDTDLEVLLFVVGTVFVFWLAHIYAAVVASRGKQPPSPLRTAIHSGVRHTYGMLVAMLVPAALLGLGAVGLVEEYTAYYLALSSGIVLLAAIGWANATRNRSPWPWRVGGALVTTALGLLVIGLSIIAH